MSIMSDHTATRRRPPSTVIVGDDEVLRMIDMVREISRQTDPQTMISVFRKETPRLYGGDGSLSISRRDLKEPLYRITRSTRWQEDINPWTQTARLPLLRGGLLADLLYSDTAGILKDFSIPATDPGHAHLEGARALLCLPLFDGGVALNMVVRWSLDPCGFDHVRLADAILTANLFGRATNTLVIARRLEAANLELDFEMKQVADLQRSLLPPKLPTIPTLDIAADYQTAARAGGDYYDFFDLEDGRWGVVIADVSGHGTPAAVVMAILRTLLHARCNQRATPAQTLAVINQHLCEQANRIKGMFVTAFYGIYHPGDGSLHYSCAGHCPPLLVGGSAGVRELDAAQGLPLAVDSACEFPEGRVQLVAGDTLLLYTDGITEAANENGEMYGRDRLLSCVHKEVTNAQHIIECITTKLLVFTKSGSPQDDRTLVAMCVR